MDANESPDGDVVLRLSKAEALVLFEWLHRAEDLDASLAQLNVADQAEQRVLWDISASLEPVLVEPFRADWEQTIEAARAQLRHTDE